MVFEKRYTEGGRRAWHDGPLEITSGPQGNQAKFGLSAVRPFLRQQLAGIRGLSR